MSDDENSVSVIGVTEDITEAELAEHGIDIRNISATVVLEGEFDRERLAEDLRGAEYDPDRHRSVVFRSSDVENFVALIPPRGRVSLAGVKSKQGLVDGVHDLLDALAGLDIDREPPSVRIENIVATADLGRGVDLNTVAIGLGLEKTEYEPEVFPGLIHQNNNTVLLFGSGKIVVLGVTTYADVLKAYQDFSAELDAIGV